MIVPGMLVCSSFLISVCMFIVLKALLISSATVIVRTGGAIWLNPFATVLFTVCSTVTVEGCVLYPCCVGLFGYVRNEALLQCLCNYGEEAYGPVCGALLWLLSIHTSMLVWRCPSIL